MARKKIKEVKKEVKKAKKVVKKVVKKEPKKEPKYKLEINVNGETTIVKTNDVLKGLQKYEPPAILKTNFVIQATHGRKVVDVIVPIRSARRMFHNSTALELLAVNLMRRLG